jgi:hypothetical protein
MGDLVFRLMALQHAFMILAIRHKFHFLPRLAGLAL